MARTFPTNILIRSEFQYFAIEQKLEKKSSTLKKANTFVLLNNNAEKLLHSILDLSYLYLVIRLAEFEDGGSDRSSVRTEWAVPLCAAFDTNASKKAHLSHSLSLIEARTVFSCRPETAA